MKKIKNVKKRWIKNVVDKLKKLLNEMTKILSKVAVLVSYNVHDNVWQLWLFIKRIFYSAHVKSITIESFI